MSRDPMDFFLLLGNEYGPSGWISSTLNGKRPFVFSFCLWTSWTPMKSRLLVCDCFGNLPCMNVVWYFVCGWIPDGFTLFLQLRKNWIRLEISFINDDTVQRISSLYPWWSFVIARNDPPTTLAMKTTVVARLRTWKMWEIRLEWKVNFGVLHFMLS